MSQTAWFMQCVALKNEAFNIYMPLLRDSDMNEWMKFVIPKDVF